VVNLYPFEATVAKGAPFDDCIENIDIGGPAMIRGARRTTMMSRWSSTRTITPEFSPNSQRSAARRWPCENRWRKRPIARTAAYDAAISNWFANELGEATPAYRAFGGKLAEALRYGENPHQDAAFYRTAEKALRRRRPPGRCRASSFPTTTSTTPTQPTNASRNFRGAARPA